MAYKLQLKRGLLSALPIGISGEPLFTTDTNDLYISNGTTNQKFQKFIASGISSQFLKGDGSLDSTTYQPLLTNPVTGTGTTNYLPKWTSGSAIGNSNLQTDASGNIGLGVTPSAWSVTALQGTSSFSIANAGNNGMNLLSNAYYGTGWTYTSSAEATWYQQLSGSHRWHTAPSGTASTAITFTQAMTLFTTGNLALNSTTDSGERLQVSGTMKVTAAATFSSDVTISGVLQETVTTNRQTASYTLALTDRGKLVEMNVATANNLTVPLNSSIAFPIGTKIDLAQYGAGQTTVVATSGVTVRSAGGALKLTSQYSGATLVKIATDEWYLFGNITV